MTFAFDITPVSHLVERLSFRVGQLEGRGFPWQRNDARLLREARDMLDAIHRHVREHGEDVTL